MLLQRRRWTNREFRRFSYRACTRPFDMLTVRVAVLEYSQLHKKAYNLVVCEFGGFENVLRDVGIRAIPIFHYFFFVDGLERQGALKMLIRTYIAHACALAQTAPLLSRRLVTRQWRLF